MKQDKNKIIINIMTLLIITTLLLGGFSYAYYKTKIRENEQDKSIGIQLKKLEVIYDDGTGAILADGIEPGYTATKTFTVENTGDEEVSYALYLEDVINTFSRTSDWEFELSCSPNCVGTNGIIEYPQLNEMLVENTIPSKVKQTYTMNIKYKYLKDINQSEDMGKTLSGRFQIYSLENVVDIEGTIAIAEEGDYVEINSVPKKSQIVNGKYKLSAVDLGNHTLKVMKKDGTEKGKTSLTIERGLNGVDRINGSTIIIADNSQTVSVNITDVSENLNITVLGIRNYVEKKGTLTYAILNNNNVSEPLTVPGQTVSLETESVLAASKDDYGTSYYFRGNVQNNYVNYSGMCWRIVRIQGDGTTKLVLADENGECNASTYNVNNKKTALINNGETLSYSNSSYDKFDDGAFKNSYIPSELTTWMNKQITNTDGTIIRNKNLNESKLAETEWCNDITIIQKGGYGYDAENNIVYTQEEATKDWFPRYHFGATGRLSDKTTANPSFQCNFKGLDGTKSLKYKNIIGVLSADEIAFAGAVYYSRNESYYLYNNANSFYYWTLSPGYYSTSEYGGGGTASSEMNPLSIFAVSMEGSLQSETGNDPYQGSYVAIRPAIVLQSTALATTQSDTETYGEIGTYTNPYVITE